MEKYHRVEKQKPQDEHISETEIRVTTQGKMRNYIAYATSLLNNPEKKANEIVLKAMGRAINKTVTIAEILKRRVTGLHQLTRVDSTDITDVWEPLEEGLDRIETTRHVSSITIVLSKDPLDASAPGYQPPIPEDQVKPFAEGRGRGFRGRGRGFRGRGRGFRGGYRGFRGRGYFRGGRGFRGRGRGFRGGYGNERGGYNGVSERGGYNGGNERGGYERGYERGGYERGGYERGGYERGGYSGQSERGGYSGQSERGGFTGTSERGGLDQGERGRGGRGGRGRGGIRGGRGNRGGFRGGRGRGGQPPRFQQPTQ